MPAIMVPYFHLAKSPEVCAASSLDISQTKSAACRRKRASNSDVARSRVVSIRTRHAGVLLQTIGDRLPAQTSLEQNALGTVLIDIEAGFNAALEESISSTAD